ncbi:MAG: Uma2 family endonuclease [Planctomycetia bacterium]|nr:Uma2 family endonuclease [Planctomycetia bacterium]
MSTIVIADTGSIPDWVSDLEAFRRWARSDDFPESGTISYLDGAIWVDNSMEQLFTHNQVKAAITAPLVLLVQQMQSGRFVPDRMLYSNVAVGFSTEPDGLYFNWSTVQSGRLKLIEGADGGFVELEGIPDMVLEVVSRTSVRKDTVVLRKSYWEAGISEYWLVDARGANPAFEILRHTSEGYVSTETGAAGIFSSVFGKSFRMLKRTDPLGNPEFLVEHS